MAKYLLLILLIQCVLFLGDGFDVKEHLSSTTRYDVSRNIDKTSEEPVPPAGCTPIHVNLVARHGTRAPTKKRMQQLESLELRLKTLLAPLYNDSHIDKSTLPVWLDEWHSSWKGKFHGGELVLHGEEEMFSLGQRLGSKYPQLFSEYHPEISPIFATQVQRSSQSAVAFGMGLFLGKGSLGPGQHRAFSVISDNRTNDIHLRFHDCCQNYKESKASRKPAVKQVQDEVYNKVASSVSKKYKIPFTARDISSLWFLCKQEASLLEVTNQACELFSPEQVELLEWADDVELHHLKGYGDSINYRMGISLLRNVKESMELAIKASEGSTESRFLEKGKFRFAHAETVIPFACLLGLFLKEGDVKLVQKERSVGIPEKPPGRRAWKGSVISPYGANTMLVLYKCEGQKKPSYKVEAFHNEKPVIMPACNGAHFCPLDIFMEKVAAPHLKHSFEGVCKRKEERGWVRWVIGMLGFGDKSSSSSSSSSLHYDDDGEL